MMLSSCRDVLKVDRAALYLRNSTDGPFHLVAALGAENIPIQFVPVPDFLESLHQAGSLQRVTPVSRSEMTPVQNVLRELRADLVHALEVGNGIVGLVLLSGRKNAVGFTAEDLTFLNALGQITNVALRSAKLELRLNEELRHKVERVASQQRQIAALQAELSNSQEDLAPRNPSPDFRRGEIKGSSSAIEQVLETVKKVASSESTVLIRGESGTGKELLAQVLHDNSPRSAGPMIRVHCAALSPGLLESELFGHVKGAFTGAHRDKVGRFEAAHGGTLFLDEIGDISLETQVKLLRVLQERCFEPVGGTRTVHVDVRLITATHQNLEKLIMAGRFREDLYYRLNVITLKLPGLRERRDDILELAVHFLSRGAKKLGGRMKHFDDDTLEALEQYHWPGNIRELENVVERAVVLAEGDRITLRDLPVEIARGSSRLPRQVVEAKPARIAVSTAAEMNEETRVIPVSKTETVVAEDSPSEREMLIDALNQCRGNKARAARLLGMPRSTYFSKLKKHAIE
jgi:transcriptional regulator with GAF, ATPase, and Fis domain